MGHAPRVRKLVEALDRVLSRKRIALTVSLDARAARDQFAGRNIQMAAGSFAARTAKKSRSN